MSGCEEGDGDGEGEGVVSFYQDAKMRQASGYHVKGPEAPCVESVNQGVD